MTEHNSASRINLLHGAAFMVAGLVWGMAIGATPYPRLALGAHIQFTTSGLMLLVAGLVIAHAALGQSGLARWILVLAPWGVWFMTFSQVANSWWGASKMLPIAAEQAGASGAAGWQESVVVAAHVLGAVGVLAYWIVILAGLLRTPRERL